MEPVFHRKRVRSVGMELAATEATRNERQKREIGWVYRFRNFPFTTRGNRSCKKSAGATGEGWRRPYVLRGYSQLYIAFHRQTFVKRKLNLTATGSSLISPN